MALCIFLFCSWLFWLKVAVFQTFLSLAMAPICWYMYEIDLMDVLLYNYVGTEYVIQRGCGSVTI